MKSWSELDWDQLQTMWQMKVRYGGNAHVARVAALLAIEELEPVRRPYPAYHPVTGEPVYTLRNKHGELIETTPRELSQMAQQMLPWFDWPYGDPGESAKKDDNGNEIAPPRDPVRGYVSPMHDAMILPRDTIKVGRKMFALPSVACNNLTWQQYRALQAVAPQLFGENLSEADTIRLQAEFMANCLVPRSLALLDTAGGSIRLRPHYEYRYNAEQADGLIMFWQKHGGGVLFHICFQCYQTALTYYSQVYPLLFSGGGKNDAMRDALQGEVGTINTVMKYAGYAEQQQVYDSNLPFILDILNTMTKEAKEIERMNARIKKH